MKNKLLIFFCLILTGTNAAFAQIAAPIFVDSVEAPKYGPTSMISHYHNVYSAVGVSGLGGLNSSALNARFVRPFLFGGHIENDVKDEVDGRMKSFNLAGADLNFEVQYVHRADSVRFLGFKGLNWDVSLSDNQHVDMKFSDNAFRTLFYGNKRFEGDTIQLADINLQSLRYQKLEFGASMQRDKYTFALGAAYLKGESHSQTKVRNARMYTAEFGTEIALDLDMSTHRSDTSQSGIGAWNGHGFSFDAGIQYHDSTWGTILFEADNIGFITWNDKSIHRRVDSSYHFDGVHIDNLLDIRDTVFSETADSASNFINPPAYTKAYSTYIPGTIRITYAQRFDHGLTMVSGAQIRIQANYAPRFFIEGRKKWVKSEYRIQFNYGGYGGPGVGMAFSHYIKPVFLMVKCDQMEGWILPKKATGQQVFFGAVYVLK